MSMSLDFTPHSWYMGFAIKDEREMYMNHMSDWPWYAYTDDGNTYQVVDLPAVTLANLREDIRYWHFTHEKRELQNRLGLYELSISQFNTRCRELAEKYRIVL